MLTEQEIFSRYQSKRSVFSKQADITLIGHSLFDMWDAMPNGTPNLAGKTVANLGIAGITARQYLEMIIKPRRLTKLGNTVFIFLGVNDIVKEPHYSPKQVLEWICEIVSYCKMLAPEAHYYLLEATPVNNIATVDNAVIIELNRYFATHCPSTIHYLKTWQAFVNQSGELNPHYCYDGLHFTPQGYKVLMQLLTEALVA